MIDDNKIEEAAVKSANYLKGICDFTVINAFEEGFKEGAKWAVNELLKDLWHQKDEEPEGYDEWILLHYSAFNYYSLSQVKSFKSWKEFVDMCRKWFYQAYRSYRRAFYNRILLRTQEPFRCHF